MSEHNTSDGAASATTPALQLIVSFARAGDFPAAEDVARTIADSDVAINAWRLLSELNANLQRWEHALSDIENALRLDPDSRSLRFARAVLFGQGGNDRAALAELEALAREAEDSPRLLVHLATQLASAGRAQEAQQALLRGLERWPVDADLHAQLARLLWQGGAGFDAMQPLEQAIAAHPRELHLLLVAADLLRKAGACERALQLLERGIALAPDSATFRTSLCALLEGMDRLDEALACLHDAYRRAPHSLAARRNLVPALLRTGAAREARALVDELLAQFPEDQMLLAQRATALRLLGDEEYRRLYDYQRLVKTFALRPMAPFADIADFNAAFARELSAMHRAARHPLEQSLRGGSQTERSLPRENPVVATFFAMLDAPLREYVGALDRASPHPVDRRARANYAISGSWSVQLQPGGFHIDHVHPRGWLSSAYYVSLPDVSDADSRGGWLKFGEPGMRIPGVGPELFVKPEEGMLVLFPSYMWHDTVGFDLGRPRLTAAFDVIPV
jgi:tetratricopeptide (TPR) repeat protein